MARRSGLGGGRANSSNYPEPLKQCGRRWTGSAHPVDLHRREQVEPRKDGFSFVDHLLEQAAHDKRLILLWFAT